MDFKKNSRRGRLCSEHVVCLSVSAAIIISLIKVAEIAAICLITWRSYQKPCLVDKNTCGHSRNSSHLIISNVTVKAHVDLRDSLYVTGPACELCPLNWIALDGSCYYFSVDRMNWSASKLNCEQMKSDLVSLENSKEKDFIYRQISSRKGHFWIGLKKKNDEWFWETGEKCITQPHAEHDCATIGRDLSPESCSNPNKWICEKKTIKYPSI